jgi:hypothetical protein
MQYIITAALEETEETLSKTICELLSCKLFKADVEKRHRKY